MKFKCMWIIPKASLIEKNIMHIFVWSARYQRVRLILPIKIYNANHFIDSVKIFTFY